jgi:hypothetical protein
VAGGQGSQLGLKHACFAESIGHAPQKEPRAEGPARGLSQFVTSVGLLARRHSVSGGGSCRTAEPCTR